MAKRHRLDLVMRDVDGGCRQPLVQARELAAHAGPELRVEVGERLVHQERARLADQRAAHRDPLALAAGERGGLAVHQLAQPEHAAIRSTRSAISAFGTLRRRSPKARFSRTVLCG